MKGRIRAIELDDNRANAHEGRSSRASSARRSRSQEVELAEPKAGEVLVRLVACGVCHTDLYTASGADPSGLCADGARPRGRRHRRGGSGTASTSVAPGDHVVTLFSPQCRECVPLPRRADEPLPRDPRAAEPGLSARTARRGSPRGGEPIRHFMGTSTFAEYTVMPEIALARDHAGGAARPGLRLRVRPLDRARRGDKHCARCRPGSTCVVFGAGLVGLGAVAGCRLQGAERIIAVDLSADRLELARGQGATEVLAGGPDTVQQILDLTGGFGADYTFEATGQRRGDAAGGRVGPHGLGPRDGVRRRRQGRDARRRAALPDHRPPRRRLVVRRRQGPRRRAAARRPLARAASSTSSR